MMDEIVRQALAKWPNVPDCYGWLSLDARGRWRIGPDRAPLVHRTFIALIGRNYMCDRLGRWYFQNGPQRVFVDLESTPFVWQLNETESDAMELVDHLGQFAISPEAIYLDSRSRVIIVAGERVGTLHDHDSLLISSMMRDGAGETIDDDTLAERLSKTISGEPGLLQLKWPKPHVTIPVLPVDANELARQFQFIQKPTAAQSA